jgi:hypothetical protein
MNKVNLKNIQNLNYKDFNNKIYPNFHPNFHQFYY